MFRKTLELSPEGAVAPLEFLDSEIQREEEEFEDQILDAPEDTESPPEELLEVPPSKRRPAWYQETVQEGKKHKAPPETFRESIRPQKYSGLMSQLISAESSSYEEATSKQVWVDAMIEEYNSIMKNDVWEVALRPTEKSTMAIDPVSRYSTFRTIILLVALFGWKLHQTDVKTVFLNDKIKMKAYVEQHEDFVKKVLFAPRVWYARMDGLLHDLDFSKSTT